MVRANPPGAAETFGRHEKSRPPLRQPQPVQYRFTRDSAKSGARSVSASRGYKESVKEHESQFESARSPRHENSLIAESIFLVPALSWARLHSTVFRNDVTKVER